MHLYIDLSTARVLLAYHVGWVACIAVHICRDMISNIISSFVSWPCLRWFSGHCVDVVSLRTSTRARPPVCTFMRAHVHMYIRVYCVCKSERVCVCVRALAFVRVGVGVSVYVRVCVCVLSLIHI